ncbi:hypothetical protein F4780DRAFT_191301 [Xylariomycetidae sp. FL0641]|nr:hypothetical protein F4780DRAFT_191301 [Xylariomycetidae sp. FL0641]
MSTLEDCPLREGTSSRIGRNTSGISFTAALRAESSRPNRAAQIEEVYRSHTGRSSRQRNVARHRERRDREREELDQLGRVSPEGSESDSSINAAKPKRSHQGSIKYLVRGFLRAIKKYGKDEGRKTFSDGESFFPSPKVTFLIDQPDNLVCQICQETPLKMALSSEQAQDTVPAVMACGHVACKGCLDLWFDTSRKCPFCRKDLVHTGCDHLVRPRLVAHDSIHSIPRTLSEGGTVGHKCHGCRDKERRVFGAERWASLAERFKEAREEAERLKTDEANEAMKKAQKAFEQFGQNQACDSLYASHASW